MRIESKEVKVPEDGHGLRLDFWLARRFQILSRAEWQQRIADGDVLLNGRPARASRRLNSGDQVNFSYRMRDEPEVPTTIELLYEDKDYLVVNKPAGLPVHPSGIYKTQTVTTLLTANGILQHPYLLHRLDRETSGILLLAKNRAAAARFQLVMRKQGVKKIYLVAVEGNFSQPIDARGYIYRLPESRLPRQRFYSDKAPPAQALEVRDCHTTLRPVAAASALSLVEAILHTGRMHQIRATLSSLGYPVVGDKLYGVDPECYFRFADGMLNDSDRKRLRLERCALHCYQMKLSHPFTGNPWQLEALLPEDIASLFR